MHDKIAYRYAKAIFDYFKTPDKIRALLVELNSFEVTLAAHSELAQVLTTAFYSEEDRKAVVKDVVAKLGLSSDAGRVLSTLSSSKRVGALKAISERLNYLMLEALSVVPLKVETATALDADEKKKVEEKFQTVLSKKVEANYSVETNLIGGLKVTAGGRTYDGSLSGWLGNFEASLLEG